MPTIQWYQCSDGITPDCEGDSDTMVADERDGVPAFSVWRERYFKDMGWRWAAWAPPGGTSQDLSSGHSFATQQAAMDAAQQWLDATPPPASADSAANVTRRGE